MNMFSPRPKSEILQFPWLILAVVLGLGMARDGYAQTAPTNIQISGAVQQSSVTRLGVNLGDQTYWDSGQMMKNLVWRNPGFEGLAYRTILGCAVVTANTCQDDDQGSPQPAGFWANGTYEVLSGAQIGVTGTVVSSAAANSAVVADGVTVTFDKNVNLAAGDVVSVKNYFPGGGDQGWWAGASGGGSYSTETTDLSAETPGKQALLMSASGSGQSVSAIQYFDSYTGLSFIQLNGAFEITFRAKGVGGQNQLQVLAQRIGGELYVSQTVQLTNTWQDYKLTFNASEDGTAVGTIQLNFTVAGSDAELDDVSMDQTDSSTSNPSAFRDGVVNALNELHPGTIRMMASEAALGSDVLNQIQAPFARYREGFNVFSTTAPDVAYGIHEFLQLCQTVGADPWITIPTATTPEEMTDFIEYLTGTGSDPWSTLRISRGQTEPWTSVFHQIHIELGNETWNSGGKGQAMWYPAYPQWSNYVFAAARATPGFQASQFDLVMSGFAGSWGYNQAMLATATQQDSVDIAPYLMSSANNEAQATMFGAMFAEPEMFDTAGGEVYQNMVIAAATPAANSKSTNVNVYETNLATTGGSVTEAQVNALTPSVGAGLAHTDHMLQMMGLGVKVQNAFSLPEFDVNGGMGLVKLWGIVVDMGTTNRRRPQFLTQALANTVIGGNMLQAVQSGSNPTWNQPLSSDSVQLNGAHYLQSFAFLNNGTSSVIVFNLNQTTALPVTFSGADAPSGTVTMSQITSANVTDNNETSLVVQPATQTLSGFNPATGLTLPPFSMTVLSWDGGLTQPPQFSVPAGTYSSTQTVTLTDMTPGAVMYYTTDGSAPTTSSTQYSAPITVSATETLNALAVASGYSNSTIASATYTIQPVATAPVFSLPTGTYDSGQTVTITDAVSGATIYYTTNGSTPTTSSNTYTGPISVGATETLSALAAAPNYTNSAVTTAVYTIAGPTAAPTFSIPGGTYTGSQSVQILDATSGATIHFTVDGTTPSVASTNYTGPITVNKSETLQAMATSNNATASAVTSATYTIVSPTAQPTFSLPAGGYGDAQTVRISDATAGATIYFTVDGTTPTEVSVKYTGPITVSKSETVSAIAMASKLAPSAVTTANYTIAGTIAKPTFSIPSGNYAGPQTVTISEATAGTTIYFTTSGKTPTASSIKYEGPFTVRKSMTVQAIAVGGQQASSPVATANYTIETQAAHPTFSLRGGRYASAQTVSLSDATEGATIFFTTSGNTPTIQSTRYVGPFIVSRSMMVQAIAIAGGYSDSSVTTENYDIETPATEPTLSLRSGRYAGTQTVTISDATAGASIYFTTDGNTPTDHSTRYTGPFNVSKTMTVKATAIADGYLSSTVVTAKYAIELPAAEPTFSLKSGTYSSTQTVTLTDATPGATIYFTTNGKTPTNGSTRYVGPFQVSDTLTVRAIAVAEGTVASPVATATFAIELPAAAPTFSTRGGRYEKTLTLTISDKTPGAAIYFSTNGKTPTNASTRYDGPFEVNRSMTIRAVAYAERHVASTEASASFAIVLQAAQPAFSVRSGTYGNTQRVALDDATPGATIYFTVNGKTPTTSSTRYAGSFEVTKSMTVRAIAVAEGHVFSNVAKASYTIVKPTAEPTFNLKSGTYDSIRTVSLDDATAGASIYFTVDGKMPTTSSTKYVRSFQVKRTTKVMAIAVAPEHVASEVATATFDIRRPTAE